MTPAELAEGLLLGLGTGRRARGRSPRAAAGPRRRALDVARDRAEIAVLVIGGEDHDRPQVLAHERRSATPARSAVGDGADRRRRRSAPTEQRQLGDLRRGSKRTASG